MFSSVTGRGKFTFHIWILGPNEVYAVSLGMITFFISILGLSEVCTHKHSHDNINNDNDDKIVIAENIVKSENATKNNVDLTKLNLMMLFMTRCKTMEICPEKILLTM